MNFSFIIQLMSYSFINEKVELLASLDFRGLTADALETSICNTALLVDDDVINTATNDPQSGGSEE